MSRPLQEIVKRLDQNIYSAKEYGASANGVSDDSGNLQAAIDAAEAAGGGIVFLDEGDYKVNQSVAINNNGVYLAGAGRSASRIFTEDTSVTPVKIGSQSISGKIKYNGVQDLKIEAASSADSGVKALQVYGTTFFNAYRLTVAEGDSGFYMRNCDRFTVVDVDVECNDSGSTLVDLEQGETDDVTIGSFTGLNASVRGSSQVALKFGDAVGSSNANEFNRIAFIGGRLGGSNETGTTLIQMVAGARNVSFYNMQFRYGRTASLDCTTSDSSYRTRLNFHGCAFFGNSSNDTTDHIKVNSSDHFINIDSCQFDNGVDHISCEGNNPRIVIRNVEMSNATNFINVTSGNPRVSISGYGKIGGSVTTRFNGSAQIRFSSDVTGDWNARVEDTATITSGNTTVAVSGWGLDWTPDKRDINFTQDASTSNDPGRVWITSLSAAGCTFNCSSDPGASGLTLKYRVSR